jgi:hypothetical protein
MNNRMIADWLVDYAHYLQAREANLYRARAYRRGAQTVLELDRPITEILEETGRQGLEALPGIGKHLAYTIDSLVQTGEFRTHSGNAPFETGSVARRGHFHYNSWFTVRKKEVSLLGSQTSEASRISEVLAKSVDESCSKASSAASARP